MDKDNNNSINHTISMNDRKNLHVTGIKKIENFDDKEFVVDTVMGTLIIKGEKLELIKLDTTLGNISIKGRIDCLEYKNDIKAKTNQGIINRLFK